MTSRFFVTLVNKSYCWWTRSQTTTWDVFFNPENNWIFTISTGAGFLQVPSTVHPPRLTWNIIMEVWKIIFLSKWVIFRFHVNLPGCIKDLCEVFPKKKPPPAIVCLHPCLPGKVTQFFGMEGEGAPKRLVVRYPASCWPFLCTPWKINMEPTNHPYWKENDLPSLHDYVPC